MRKYNNFIAFIDFLFCISLLFICLFVLSMTQTSKGISLDKLIAVRDQAEKYLIDLQESESKKIILQDDLDSKEKRNINQAEQIDSLNRQLAEADSLLTNALSESARLNQKILDLENNAEDNGGNWLTATKMAIVVSWDGKCDDDIDLWILTPTGKSVYYGDREYPGMFLDRDDLGKSDHLRNDSHVEVARFFDLKDGIYVVNVHSFLKKDKEDNKVNVKIYSGKNVVFNRNYVFTQSHEVARVSSIAVENGKIKEMVHSDLLIRQLNESIKRFKSN